MDHLEGDVTRDAGRGRGVDGTDGRENAVFLFSTNRPGMTGNVARKVIGKSGLKEGTAERRGRRVEGHLTEGTGMLSRMSASASSFCQTRKLALSTFFMTLNKEQAMALRTSSV